MPAPASRTDTAPSAVDARALVEGIRASLRASHTPGVPPIPLVPRTGAPADPGEPSGGAGSGAHAPVDLPAPLPEPGAAAIRRFASRLRGASGVRHAVRVGTRRAAVATLAVLRGYFDEERELTTRLVRANEAVARRMDALDREIALLTASQGDLLYLAGRLHELAGLLEARAQTAGVANEPGAPDPPAKPATRRRTASRTQR